MVGYRRGWLSRGFDALIMLPLGTSAVTVGFGFIVALDRPPLDLRTSALLIPIAHSLIAMPFVLRAVAPVIRSIDPRLREAAAVLGAAPRRVWREVDLPVIRRAALVGAAFAFAVSLGEFGATLFIARPDTPTIPVAVARLLSQPGDVAVRAGDGHEHGADGAHGDLRCSPSSGSAAPVRSRSEADAPCWWWSAWQCGSASGPRSRTSASRSPMAKPSAFSGRAAAARRHCCASLPGSSRHPGGTVRLDGRDLAGVPAHQRGIGLMFQDFALFPHRDVAGNVAFGLRMQGVDRRRQRCSRGRSA